MGIMTAKQKMQTYEYAKNAASYNKYLTLPQLEVFKAKLALVRGLDPKQVEEIVGNMILAKDIIIGMPPKEETEVSKVEEELMDDILSAKPKKEEEKEEGEDASSD